MKLEESGIACQLPCLEQMAVGPAEVPHESLSRRVKLAIRRRLDPGKERTLRVRTNDWLNRFAELTGQSTKPTAPSSALAATDLQAWTIKEGTTASRAAGKIHTDFEKGFIRADVYNFADLIKTRSEQQIKESGQIRSEGKDYIIKEGDIVRYHHKI